MTDRELLELAAKAIGGQVSKWDGEFFLHAVNPFTIRWNPLEDDGDRYRLIKALKINIDFYDQCAWKRLPGGELLQEYWHEPGDNADPEWGDEAHAVLRVAAEIGRAMP